MTEIPSCLVTGATGALGPRIVQAAHEAGYRVRTLSLDQPPSGVLPQSVETHVGDINDASAVHAAVQGMDIVLHLAALLHIVNPPPILQERFRKVNVEGTATVIKAAREAGVKRIVFSSTIAVYGRPGGQTLTEETPPHPDTFYGQTKLAAERLVLSARRRDGQPLGTVLRFAAVYGARIKGNYRKLVQALSRGLFVPIGPGANRRALLYDRDAARALLLAAGNPAAAGRLYIVSDGRAHTLHEIINAICVPLGRTPPRFHIPFGAARLAAGVIETACRLVRIVPPISRAALDKYEEDVAVDSSRVCAQLQFSPQYDLSAGWAEAIRELRSAGEL